MEVFDLCTTLAITTVVANNFPDKRPIIKALFYFEFNKKTSLSILKRYVLNSHQHIRKLEKPILKQAASSKTCLLEIN